MTLTSASPHGAGASLSTAPLGSASLGPLPPRPTRRLGRPLPPADLLDLTGEHGELRALTARGILPLYRFTPLQAAVLFGETVPYASHWPEHMKLFLYQYVPLPALPSPAAVQVRPGTSEALPGRVHTQPRDPYGLRTWEHATYQGWPLYLYAHDEPGRPARGTVPHLFEPVRLDQPYLPAAVTAGHGP